jgi:nitrite reductase/ring-hydroxylating ferredoxin subunit
MPPEPPDAESTEAERAEAEAWAAFLDSLDAPAPPGVPPGDPAAAQPLWRVAAQLRAVRAAGPNSEFLRSLRGRLEEALRPAAATQPTRRVVLGAAVGLAAGLLAGVGVESLVPHASAPPGQSELVGGNGRWVAVADAVQALQTRVTPFQAGAVAGFIVSDGQGLHALSAICTHMGCHLRPAGDPSPNFLQCPCHGAAFSLLGQQLQGPSYRYAALPPLPALRVCVDAGHVWVWVV